MHANDEPLIREIRRELLALDFLKRDVRTCTIIEWTGLRRARIDSLRRAYDHEFPGTRLARPSGPAPHTLRELLRSPSKRSEAAAFGALCRSLNIIPAQPMADARRYLPSLVRGERLISLYDHYRRLVPDSEMTIEILIAVLMDLAEGGGFELGGCHLCQAAILVDRFGIARRQCMHCQHASRHAERDIAIASLVEVDHGGLIVPSLPSGIYQVTLFDVLDIQNSPVHEKTPRVISHRLQAVAQGHVAENSSSKGSRVARLRSKKAGSGIERAVSLEGSAKGQAGELKTNSVASLTEFTPESN